MLQQVAAKIAALVAPIEGAVVQDPETRAKHVVRVVDLMDRLQTFRHSDDRHHNGETILEHITEVYAAVEESSRDWPTARREMLLLVALLHDLGKAYTFAVRKNRNTFYAHNNVSTQIADLLLHGQPGTQEVVDLVYYHDAFFMLAHSRTPGSTKYVRKFAQLPVSHGEQLENLVAFSLADSAHAKARQETMDSIMQSIEDIARYRQEQAACAAETVLGKDARLEQHRAEIVALVEEAVPGSSAFLPDLKAVNKLLGQAGRVDVIKAVQQLVGSLTLGQNWCR